MNFPHTLVVVNGHGLGNHFGYFVFTSLEHKPWKWHELKSYQMLAPDMVDIMKTAPTRFVCQRNFERDAETG